METTKPTTENNQDPNRPPTPAEIAAYQNQMLTFYKTQLPFLRKQEEYGRLMANVAEDRLRKVTAEMQYAKVLAAQPTAQDLENMAKQKREAELRASEEVNKKPAEEGKSAEKAPAEEKLS